MPWPDIFLGLSVYFGELFGALSGNTSRKNFTLEMASQIERAFL